MLSAKAQLKILELCKGMTVGQAQRRLEIMGAYVAQKELALRVKLAGLTIGDKI